MDAPTLAHVLVVDDEEDIRLTVKLALHPTHVIGAADAPEAMAALHANTVDLVILDVSMPGDDGLTLLHRLRASRDFRHLPVVMLTARSAEHDHVLGFEAGADAYLTKPFDVEALAAVVTEVFERTPVERAEAREVGLGRAQLLREIELRFGV